MIENQKGVALFQTLFLALAVSFLAYYLMDIGQLLNRSVKVNKLAEALRDFRSKVALILSDTNSCLSTMVDFDAEGKILANKSTINSLKIKSLDYSKTPPAIMNTDLFPVGSTIRGLTVLDYNLTRVNGPEGQQGATRLYILEVKLKKAGQEVGETITETFEVFAAEINNGLIMNCFANSSENKLARHFCQNSLGGQIYEHISVKGGGHCIVEGKYLEDKLQYYYDLVRDNRIVQEQNEDMIGKNKFQLDELGIEANSNEQKIQINSDQLILEKDFHR